MNLLLRHAVRTLIVLTFCVGSLHAQIVAPIKVKVVVVAMFQSGEDTGNTLGEYHLWVSANTSIKSFRSRRDTTK